jgi:ABC-2 type transport system permease protein
MHADVLRRELLDHRRSLIGCTVGGVLLALMYVLFYPTIRSGGAGIEALLKSMPKGFQSAFIGGGVDYLSPAGYLGTELFSILVPGLLLVMGVLAGGRALAGEEQDGTIDLLLSTPIRRGRLAAEKAGGAMLPLYVVAAALWALVALAGPSQGLDVSLGGLAVALLAVALLGTGFGMLAFLISSATGSVGLGAGIAGALAVAMYALNIIGALVPALTGIANAVSPFHWDGGSGVLANGVPWSGLGLLLACPIVLLSLSLLAYERRDLTT